MGAACCATTLHVSGADAETADRANASRDRTVGSARVVAAVVKRASSSVTRALPWADHLGHGDLEDRFLRAARAVPR